MEPLQISQENDTGYTFKTRMLYLATQYCGIAVLWTLSWGFSVAFSFVQFPAPLIGLALIVSLLVGMRHSTRLQHTDVWIRKTLQPAIEWITHRYLPVFYAPAIVRLPLVVMAIPTKDIALSVVVISLGCFLTAVCTGLLVVFIRKFESKSIFPFSKESEEVRFDPVVVWCWSIACVWSVFAIVLTSGMYPEYHSDTVVTIMYISSTMCGYFVGMAMPRRVKSWFHPMIFCSLAPNLVALLIGGTGEYQYWIQQYLPESGFGAGQAFFSFLGPIILCFAFMIVEQWQTLLRHRWEVLLSCLLSPLFTMTSTAVLAGVVFHIAPEVARALIPRGATLALALPVSERLGANMAITGAAVALTGIIGGNFVLKVMDMIKVNDPIARGVTASAVSHGIGVAAVGLKETDAIPFAGLSYALCGIMTTILSCIPFFTNFLLWLTG